MIMRIGEDGFDDDPESGWKKFFGADAQTFVGNGDDFPINVFFTVIVDSAPVGMSLSGTRAGPVRFLALL